MKKLLAALFTILALAVAPVRAEVPPVDPAAAAAARELLDAMKYRDVMDKALEQMRKNVPVMMLQLATNGVNADTKLSETERKAALDKATKDLPTAVAGATEVLADPKLLDDVINAIVPVYARYFSADELKQMAAFYRTPAGIKMLAIMPQVSAEAQRMGQQVVTPRISAYVEKATGKK
jgi:hypothetical protein